MAAFVRIGAYLQRSIAHLRLGEQRAAHDDVDAAIAAHERLRGGAVLRLMAKAPEFDRLETSLWALKGRALEAESRIEEALAAYTRAAELERHGIEAAVLRGHALAATGAYAEALVVFETALARAAPGAEQADALSGKGGALVRLGQFEAAVAALQAALGARLTEPQNDPAVFELLGIAYEGLKRTGAANRAFRRAWDLTPEPKRSANLARGVSASELRLGNSKAARDFLAALPAHLTKDRTLLFNRALALDAVGERRAAIGCLVQAKDAGLDKAQEELDRLDAPAGLARWTSYWFGAQANRVRRGAGIALVAIAATIVAAPLVQWFVAGKPDWSLFMLPPLVALVLLALPSLKSVSVDAGKVKFTAEPLAATRREVAETAPEGFRIPTLTALPITPGGPLGGEHPGAPPPSLPRIKG
jgi:tetratricopeptide (TPR) repeat protein